VPPDLRTFRLPPLLLQPLVENAVKHGIGPERRGGEIEVAARLEPALDGPGALRLTVRDTGAGGSSARWRRGRELGVGLTNIERRLACHYGKLASLSIDSAPGQGTTVALLLPAEQPAPEVAVRSAR
jgi:sensor histidine kinase YesM